MRTVLKPAFLSLLLVSILALPARADQLFATRAAALQGGLASPRDNASIFLNPAGVSMYNRYDFSVFGRLQQGTPDRLFGLSLVDSKTSGEIGGGIAWVRDTGDTLPKDDFAAAASQNYAKGSIGFTGHYRIDRTRKKRADVNMDTGFVIDPWAEKFKMAVVSYNLIDPPKDVDNVHRKYAVGLGSRLFDVFEIVADGAYTAGRNEVWEWSAGVDVFVVPYVSFLAGFGQGPIGPNRKERVSGGITAGLPEDFRLGYAYVRTLGADGAAFHAAELSMFFF